MGHKNRRSIRLEGYDYCLEGIYFVTICTQGKKNIFGRVENKRMVLNKFGIIAKDEWIKTAHIRKYVKLDAFIIMPDHVHGIMVIINGHNNYHNLDHGRGMTRHAPTTSVNNNYGPTVRKFGKPIHHSLPTIIGAYKSAVTREMNKIRNTPGKIVWQRNYYERIIRTDTELHAVREYILNNPIKH